jgi:hypothetical protein
MALVKFQDQLRQKKRKRQVLMLALLAGVFVLIVGALFYCVFFAKLFDYRNIELNGPPDFKDKIKTSIDRWLSDKYYFITRRNNSFAFSINNLLSELSQQYPELENIEAEKISVHDFKINYSAKKPVGIWCLLKQNKCYYFDRNAIIFSQIEPSEGYLLTRIDDDRERIINIGSMIMSNEWMTDIFDSIAILKTNNIVISRVYVSQDSINDIDFITQAGWKILISTSTNVKSQINALINLYSEKLSAEQKSRLEYIDLRIQDRIYYK